MNPTLSVVLVHSDEHERDQLRSAFDGMRVVQVAGDRSDLRSGMALAHQVCPSILVLELAGSGEDALQAAEHYRLDHPDVAIFFCCDTLHTDTLMRAMRAGAQEVLRRPLDRSALMGAVERVAALNARRSGGGVTRRVITVFSIKGGVGVSTIATNLAVSFCRQAAREVALADLDFHSGDVASMMGLNPSRTLGDVLDAPRVESAGVQDAMTKHESGVSVLPQPEQVDRLDGLTAHQIGGVIEILGATYELVLLDCPHAVNDVALEIFDRSSTILLVVEPGITSLRAGRRSLEIFRRLNFLAVPDRVRLVLNRTSEKGMIARAQIEETLEMPIFHSIANDYAAVSEAINLGKPLCSDTPRSRAGRDIDRLAQELVPMHSTNGVLEAAPRRRKLGLFGKR